MRMLAKNRRNSRIGLLGLFFALSGPVFGNPIDPEIVHGDVTVEDFGSSLQILQESDRAIIEWADFSISAREITRFVQPDSSAAVLNRVLGPGASNIDGLLQANGRVFLLNPNGVFIGPTGRIDTAGFLASTLNLSDENFLAGGDLLFSGASPAAIVNLGTIGASEGDVILIANQVSNQGNLLAPNGMVGLGAGTEVLLAESGNERMFVRSGGSGAVGVDNAGSIQAQVAELKAGGSIYSTAIRNSGRIRATGVQRQGGRILLRAGGSRTVNSGQLEANRDDGLASVEIDAGAEGELVLEPGSTVSANQIRLQTQGGAISQLGSVAGRSEAGQIGRIDVDAGPQGAIQAAAGSETSADELTMAAEGGEVALNLGSSLETANLRVSNPAGTIRAAGQITGRGDESQISFDVSAGGEIELAPTAILRANRVQFSADDGKIDHFGHVIAENAGIATFQADRGTIHVHPMGRIEGGTIQLLAEGGSITHQGLIKAEDGGGNGGSVVVSAGAGGNVEIFGVINAVGDTGAGGSIAVTGEEVAIRAGAVLDASGAAGGGAIQVGGGFQGRDPNVFNSQRTVVEAGSTLRADATVSGPGGSVVVWSDGETIFESVISARGAGDGAGGTAEVSGKQSLTFSGMVDLGASEEDAPAGSLLLDPTDITIDSTGTAPNTASAPAIASTLASGTNVTVVTDSAGTQDGDVTVVSPIEPSGMGNRGVFSILAHDDIFVRENILIRGNNGGVNLIAGWDGVTGFNFAPGPGVTNGIVPNLGQISAVPDAFGANQGSVTIGSANGPWVGSQRGATNVLGYDVAIGTGSGVGYVGPGVGTIDGEINLVAKNGIAVADNGTGSAAAGIGHRTTSSGWQISGDISLEAQNGGISVNSSPGADLTIGHVAANRAVDADIRLEAGAGAILAASSGGSVKIGNVGGIANSGEIALDARNIGLDASGGGNVVVGSSDGAGQGAVLLRGTGGIGLADEILGPGRWKIGHQNAAGANSPVTLLGKDVRVDSRLANRVIAPNISAGDVTLGSFGALAVDSAVSYAGTGSLNLVATGDLALNRPVTNAQAGKIAFVAGWDGQTDPDQLHADPTSFGNGATATISRPVTTAGSGVEVLTHNARINAPIDPGSAQTLIRIGDFGQNGGLVDLKAGIGEATVVGSSLHDLLRGPDLDVFWSIDSPNGGNLDSPSSNFDRVEFESVESLIGGSAADGFTFLKQATLDGSVTGGDGADFVKIDDSDLVPPGGKSTYTITNARVSRNPQYTFRSVEALEIQAATGDSDTTFQTQFFDFTQHLDGGGGNNQLNVTLAPGQTLPDPVSSPLTVNGSGQISFQNIGSVNFTPPREKPGEGTANVEVAPSGEPSLPVDPGPAEGVLVTALPVKSEAPPAFEVNVVPGEIAEVPNLETLAPDHTTLRKIESAAQTDASSKIGRTQPKIERLVTNRSGIQETTPAGTVTVDPPPKIRALLDAQLGAQAESDFASTGLSLGPIEPSGG